MHFFMQGIVVEFFELTHNFCIHWKKCFTPKGENGGFTAGRVDFPLSS